MSNCAYKVMLLGCMSVGKTSIAKRMKFNTFDLDHKSTIGVQLYSFELALNDRTEEIVLWDTDGEHGENVLQSMFMKGSDAAIVVSDATREDTIESMLTLSENFRTQSPGAPVLSLINKTDLKNHSEPELAAYRRRCSEVRQCSAKNHDGVLESIEHVITLVNTTNTQHST